MISGTFGRPALPYIPGFEVAGVVETVGDGVNVRPGERAWASLGVAGGGFAEYALADVDDLARMPERVNFQEAAGLVVGGGTAWDGLVGRGRLQAGETVLITGAAGGVGTAAVQLVAAVGARPLGVASQRNRDYLRGLGASEVFDYHADDWVQQVLAVVPGGVDVLFDAAGGQTRDRAVGAVREDGRAIFLVGAPAHLGRGVEGESLDADVNRQVLEAVGRLVEAGKLRPQGRGGAALRAGSRGPGAGRGPTHARQDRAPDWVVAVGVHSSDCSSLAGCLRARVTRTCTARAV